MGYLDTSHTTLISAYSRGRTRQIGAAYPCYQVVRVDKTGGGGVVREMKMDVKLQLLFTLELLTL